MFVKVVSVFCARAGVNVDSVLSLEMEWMVLAEDVGSTFSLSVGTENENIWLQLILASK